VENLHFQTLPSIFRTFLAIAEVHTLSPALSHRQNVKCIFSATCPILVPHRGPPGYPAWKVSVISAPGYAVGRENPDDGLRLRSPWSSLPPFSNLLEKTGGY
jgi:hypothetical protein